MQLRQKLAGEVVHQIEEPVRRAGHRDEAGRARAGVVVMQCGADPEPAGYADHAADDVELGPESLRQFGGPHRVEPRSALRAEEAQECVRIDAVQRPRVVEVGAEQIHQPLLEERRALVAMHREGEDGDVLPRGGMRGARVVHLRRGGRRRGSRAAGRGPGRRRFGAARADCIDELLRLPGRRHVVLALEPRGELLVGADGPGAVAEPAEECDQAPRRAFVVRRQRGGPSGPARGPVSVPVALEPAGERAGGHRRLPAEPEPLVLEPPLELRGIGYEEAG
jgi:hypothetical protein